MISGKIIAITKYVAINFINISPHVMNPLISKHVGDSGIRGIAKPAQTKKVSVEDDR